MTLHCGPIAEWSTLLAVQAGAAATLTGLVFVAVSINLNSIVGIPGLPGRAAESILQFLEVFFISTVGLVPRLPERTLGIAFLAISVFFWSAQVAGQIRYLLLRSGHPWSWLVYRAAFSQLAALPFIVASVALLLGSPWALCWLVPGFLFSFGAGVMSAWVLLVEILR